MYTLAVRRQLIAQHYLVGGDWGAENERHSHHYLIEVQLQGRELDQHGYLVDIVEVEARLEEQLNYYRDKTLNDLPEFAGRNPSIEHFACILCQQLRHLLAAPNLTALQVTIWENDIAWTAYREEL
ncbi:MAG: 6-pyruvoyl trahydropterin synthase family protein [Desulfobacca sp.]|uniref:6-pyruvoyl trahydropterin synthase family protein n=1 Tax=Desulfobacca sp. TaxID=2067990 RepID=UPI004049190E